MSCPTSPANNPASALGTGGYGTSRAYVVSGNNFVPVHPALLTAPAQPEEPPVAEPFLSEIRLMSFVFAPKGWALCNGQLLPINQNQALFSLLGTTYGGDGRTNFALPDLRARAAVHEGAGTRLGERGGEAAHTVTLAELPAHAHALVGTTAFATSGLVGPALGLAASTGSAAYAPPCVTGDHGRQRAVQLAGGSQAHENRQPFLTLSFCIALQGIFPSHN